MNDNRLHQSRAVGLASLLIAQAAALPAALPASTAVVRAETSSMDARFAPWLGCWEPANEGGPGSAAGTGSAIEIEGAPAEARLCVEPEHQGIGVVLATFVGDQAVRSEVLRADGNPYTTERNGCRGTRTARWSADGERLYLEAHLTCEGGRTESLSGVSVVEAGRWVDVQLATGEGEDPEALVVSTYRPAGEPGSSAVSEGVPRRAAGSLGLRLEPGNALSIDDILEASAHLDSVALEAVLLESGSGFHVDAATLRRLDQAGIEEHIIDLVVAHSFPEHFVVERDGWIARREPLPVGSGATAYAYGYGPFFYFGETYHGHYWHRPIFVAPSPGDGGDRHGRVVKGQGYTRVRSRETTDPQQGRSASGGGSSSSHTSGSSSSSGSGGSVSGAGHSSGGASSGRTAVPRDG